MSKSVPRTSGKDHALVIAWTESWAKAPERIFKHMEKIGLLKSRFFQAGHAGLILIEGITGSVEYFDYGRYTTPKGFGRIRSKESDPKLAIPMIGEFDHEGNLINFKEILNYIDSIPEKTHGDGKMRISVCDKINFRKSKNYIENRQLSGCLPYKAFKPGTTNCGQFVSNALMAGVTCTKTLKRLRYQLTAFRTTPIGNVEAMDSPQNFIVSNGEFLVKNRMNRFEVLREFLSRTIKNFTEKNLEGRFPNNLAIPFRHERIHSGAQWLPGLGEGTWITLKPFNEAQFFYRIIGQSANGEEEYDYIAQSEEEKIDPNLPYKIVYDTSRLGASILQNNKVHRLSFCRDTQDNFLRKTIASESFSK